MNQENKSQDNELLDLSGFQGDTNTETSESNLYSSNTPKISKWLIKLSGGKINEKQTNYIFIITIVIAIIISILIITINNSRNKNFTTYENIPPENSFPSEY